MSNRIKKGGLKISELSKLRRKVKTLEEWVADVNKQNLSFLLELQANVDKATNFTGEHNEDLASPYPDEMAMTMIRDWIDELTNELKG